MTTGDKKTTGCKSTRDYGDMGEEYAAWLLKKRGYKIIERKFRSKVGEIDIVAQDKDTLVFVEVKTRWSKKYGKPEEAVTPRKLAKVERAGQLYSLVHPTLPKKLRVDVVAIEVERGKVTSAKVIKVD